MITVETGFLTFNKVIVNWLVATGACADNRGRRSKRSGWSVLEKLGHGSTPDRGGTGDTTGDATHRSVVIIADPRGNKVIASITESPVVTEVVSGTGFDCDRVSLNVEHGVVSKSRGAGLVVGEGLIDLKGNGLRNNLCFFGKRSLRVERERVAAAISNREERGERDFGSASGED